jgi:hypothetical protein
LAAVHVDFAEYRKVCLILGRGKFQNFGV